MRSSTTWPQQGHLRPLLSFAPFSSEAVPNVVGSANESASLSLLGAITALGSDVGGRTRDLSPRNNVFRLLWRQSIDYTYTRRVFSQV